MSKDKEKAFAKITDNWDDVVRLARGSLNYHLMFLLRAEPGRMGSTLEESYTWVGDKNRRIV